MCFRSNEEPLRPREESTLTNRKSTEEWTTPNLAFS